jgi:hypothetical protein
VGTAVLLLPGSVFAQSPSVQASQVEQTGTSSSPDQQAQKDDKERRETPCSEMAEDERRETTRCMTDAELRQADYEKLQREREERERSTRTSFLKWIHVDGLWTATEFNRRSFGLIGTHVAVMEFGRLHLYGPPGVMLVMERSGESWRARPGLTWGLSVHLTDVTMPGSQKRAGLYLNLAKLWTTGNFRNGRDMIGLSMTWGQ